MSDSSTYPIFDAAALLVELNGDAATVRELLSIYLEESPRLRAAVREAVALGNAEALRRAAHALKGTLGGIMARDASKAAVALEALARGGQLRDAAELLADLDLKLERLQTTLQQWLSEGTPP